MASPPRRRTLWDAALGLATALVVFGAVPGVLVGFVGLPVPRHWSSDDLVSWRSLFDLLAIVSWCAWAACAWPILRAATCRVRSRDVAGAVRLFDRIAVRIALGFLAWSALLGATATAWEDAPAGASTAPSAQMHTGADRPRAGARPRQVVRLTLEAGAPGGQAGVPGADRGIASDTLPRVHAAPFWLEGGLLPLVELTAAGISALVAALLARRARQLRRLRAFLREEGDHSPEPTDEEAELSALLSPFESSSLPGLIEAAARHLDSALAASSQMPGPVRWLRAGHDEVEVCFAEPVPAALAGWERTGEFTWRRSPDAGTLHLDAASNEASPWCPVLVPLGDDRRGTWLLPVPAGTCVAIVGPRAQDLVRAMRAVLASWSWHESLVLTDDPLEAATAVSGCSPEAARSRALGQTVVYFGEPHTLPPTVQHACAVLATSQVDNAEVTVMVDARGASAHPLGLTVRPALLEAALRGAVHALVDPEGSEGRTAVRPLKSDRGPAATVDVSSDEPDEARPMPLPLLSPPSTQPSRDLASCAHAPGQAEVRLLVTVPEIIGLQGTLPPSRARRAVEVVAYLAMHAPDSVTGDRLRTRVLGSSETDAAVKTLFNVVGAARRALGVGPDGQPLLPPASRSGHYRLSPHVSVDAARAWALLRDGLAARDRSEALGLLRGGLELVAAEPLGGVLTGYVWWRAEGHERRLADAVVDGACTLVRHALAGDDIDLARWALAQARKVEPSCEPLARAAMRVAAASGDARRLHAEWQECQRQIDELDPGSVPSERTEQLYALLRAQLAGDGPRSPQAQV
jgi:DNA-binding SARP family transcriptional activator